jgi:hypothetical protein
MKRRLWTVAAGAASVAALAVVPSALAAYTTAKLEVRQAGSTVTVKASLSPDDDPTASVRIHVPVGTQVTLNQAPGSTIGTVNASVKALDLAGADLPVTGQLRVAAAGEVAPALQQACLGAVQPAATWVLALGAGGQTLAPVPAYFVATAAGSTLGPGFVQICLPPPDVPPGTPGRATLGVKLYSAELIINGVISAVPAGTWVALWTPYRPGVGQVNAAGTVASPGAVAPGAVSVTARRRGNGATVSGRVTQGGQPRAGAAVVVFGGPRATRLRRIARVVTGANGAFSVRARSGVFFRANVTAQSGAAPAICTAVGAAVAPLPCVNPTIGGFTTRSRVVRKR